MLPFPFMTYSQPTRVADTRPDRVPKSSELILLYTSAIFFFFFALGFSVASLVIPSYTITLGKIEMGYAASEIQGNTCTIQKVIPSEILNREPEMM